MDRFNFWTPPATLFLRAHEPKAFGIDLSSFRQILVAASTNQAEVYGYKFHDLRDGFTRTFIQQRLELEEKAAFCEAAAENSRTWNCSDAAFSPTSLPPSMSR